jgi:class 3 adenylate cyclase
MTPADIFAPIELAAANSSDDFRRELAELIARYRQTGMAGPSPQSADTDERTRRLRERNLPPEKLFLEVTADEDAAGDPAVVVPVAGMLLERAEPILAYDLVQKCQKRDQENAWLRQMQALALARSGAPERAGEILRGLNRTGHRDAPTLAQIGGVFRDRGIRARPAADARRWFEEAYSYYEQAHQVDQSQDWFLARAAVMALLSNKKEDNKEVAPRLAREVLARCDERLKTATNGARFWPLSMQGEAYLILKDEPAARDKYRQAAVHVGHRFGELASARQHARLVVEYYGKTWDESNPVLRMPAVVVFVGHMVDLAHALERGTPRFPATNKNDVKREIVRRLQAYGAKFGFASGACGSDILFHEAMLFDQEGESTVVLPCPPEMFIERSVRPGGESWVEDFNALQEKAQVISLADQLFDYHGLSYTYNNMVLTGLAATKARQLGAELRFLAVWDGREGRGPGGTADHVKRWRDRGHTVDIIDPTKPRGLVGGGLPDKGASAASASPPAPPVMAANARDAKIVGVVFSDVNGFSKLNEEQLLLFVDQFLVAIGELLDAPEWKDKVLKKNTWGDGLFAVFDDVKAAGLYALAQRDLVAQKEQEWVKAGLPPGINLRTGVHAGPVFICEDAVTRSRNCIGMHVSRTARIEPITPEGEVYASREFVAICEAEGTAEFEFTYTGQTELAKKYGTFPTYHLRRRGRSLPPGPV